MASPLLLIILKGRCFISCECQISAIYIPQLQRASEWLLIFVLLPKMYGSGRETIGREKGAESSGTEDGRRLQTPGLTWSPSRSDSLGFGRIAQHHRVLLSAISFLTELIPGFDWPLPRF